MFVSNDLSGAYFVKLDTMRPEQGLNIKKVDYCFKYQYKPSAVSYVPL